MNLIEKNFDLLVYLWLGLAAGVFILLFFISAPYGRHARKGWGPMVPARWAWLFMELISPVLMVLCLVFAHHRDWVSVVLALMWIGHYIYRAFIFPFLLSGNSHPMPLSVIFMSVVFNAINAGTNGFYLFFVGAGYSSDYWRSTMFIAGVSLFVVGFLTHFFSDRSLRGLRRSGETGYKVPYGGLFKFVSCPNYLGELIEWSGWAMASFSLPGLVFAVWTAANLVPRAIAHHRWYRSHFADYPASRKAIIPFVL